MCSRVIVLVSTGMSQLAGPVSVRMFSLYNTVNLRTFALVAIGASSVCLIEEQAGVDEALSMLSVELFIHTSRTCTCTYVYPVVSIYLFGNTHVHVHVHVHVYLSMWYSRVRSIY